MEAEDVNAILDRCPEVVRIAPRGTPFFRAQDSQFDAEPRFYNQISDSRYGGADLPVGVLYVGFSDAVAVAEVFQGSHDASPVAYVRLKHSSLHRLVATRNLALVDLPMLANFVGLKLRDIVRAKGQGSIGYAATQALSRACMGCDKRIDGLLYPSSVYSPAGTLDGCNAALFGARGRQVEPVSNRPLLDVTLSNGKSVIRHLHDLGISLE